MTIASIKRMYWNPLFRPCQPMCIDKSRVFFTKGDFSNITCFRSLVDSLSNMPLSTNHKFILSHADPSVFYGLPENVVPVLHAASQADLDLREKEFLEAVADHPKKGLSLFCGKELIRTQNKYDVIIVKGYSYIHMGNTIKYMQSLGNPVYVDSFKYETRLDELPSNFKLRNLEGIV